jgi:RHS repeat-associated protein
VDYAFNGRRVIGKAFPGSHGEYRYDGLGRLTQILHEDTSSDGDLVQLDYGYDLGHQVTSMDSLYYDDVQATRLTGDTSDKGRQYGYDGAGRLATVLRGVATADIGATLSTNIANTAYDDLVEYDYDPTGNRTTRRIDGSDDTLYAYNTVNEMTTEGGVSQTYDTNGNFIGTSNTHKYTPDNQYGEYVGADTWSYHYDALGRMVQRENDADPVEAVRYYYDGVHAIEQNDWDPSGPTETADKLFVYGERIDELLEYVDISADPDDEYYAHTDMLGSVHVLANETGAIAESYRYKEFGETTIVDSGFAKLTTNVSGVGNPYRYTARRGDLEAGSFGDDWYHYRARVMRPDAGRFVQRDPLGYADGPNLNVYARNGPRSTPILWE